MKANFTQVVSAEGNIVSEELTTANEGDVIALVSTGKDTTMYKATIEVEETTIERWNHIKNLIYFLEEEKMHLDSILQDEMDTVLGGN